MTGAARPPPSCGVCGDAIVVATAVACEQCSAPQHSDCWDFNQGCSIFGCGGTETISFAARARELETRGISISEASRPPLLLAPLVEGLSRKFRARIGFAKATVPAGIGGALVAIFGLSFLGSGEWTITLGLLLSGTFFGLAAPFLAPTQVRSPGKLAASGAAVLFVAARFLLPMSANNPRIVPFLVGFFSGGLLFASSVAEAIAGHHTEFGQYLGRWGGAFRGVLAWVVMSLAICAAILSSQTSFNDIYDIMQNVVPMSVGFGLLGGAVAVPAMEQGKRSFLLAITPESETA